MNMTGTPAAYRPPGSILASGKRPPATGDYQAWQPPGEGTKPAGR
jgi:NADH:ubiquinone oxidoreductase subunit